MRGSVSFGLLLVLLAGCAPEERGILFSSTRDGIQDVYVMDPDGSNVRRLTFTEGELGSSHTSMATWSPSGDLIAFSSDRPIEGEAVDSRRNSDVFLMNRDGGGIRRLTLSPASDGQPDFSPDGAELVLVSDRDGNLEIYTLSLDDGESRRLTEWEGDDEFPDWSPDGSKVRVETDSMVSS